MYQPQQQPVQANIIQQQQLLQQPQFPLATAQQQQPPPAQLVQPQQQQHKPPPPGVILVGGQSHAPQQQQLSPTGAIHVSQPQQLPNYSTSQHPQRVVIQQPQPQQQQQQYQQQPPVVKLQHPQAVQQIVQNGTYLQQGNSPNPNSQPQQRLQQQAPIMISTQQQQQRPIQIPSPTGHPGVAPPNYNQIAQPQPKILHPQQHQQGRVNTAPTPTNQQQFSKQHQRQRQQRGAQQQKPTSSSSSQLSSGPAQQQKPSTSPNPPPPQPAPRQDLQGPGAIDADEDDGRLVVSAPAAAQVKKAPSSAGCSTTSPDPFNASSNQRFQQQANQEEEDFLMNFVASTAAGSAEEFVASTGLRELVGVPLPPAPATVDTPPKTPDGKKEPTCVSSTTTGDEEENPTIPIALMAGAGIIAGDDQMIHIDTESEQQKKMVEKTETDKTAVNEEDVVVEDEEEYLEEEVEDDDEEYYYQGPMTEVIRYTIEHSRRNRVEDLQQLGAQKYLEEKAFLRAMRADRNVFQQPEVLASSSYWHPQGYYIYMKTNAGVHETMAKHTDHLLAKLHTPQTLAFMWPPSEGVKSMANIAWIFEHQMFGPIAQCRIHFDEEKGGLAFITYTCVGAEEVVFDLFKAQRAPFLAEDIPGRSNGWKLELAATFEDDYDEPDHLQQLADFKREVWGTLMNNNRKKVGNNSEEDDDNCCSDGESSNDDSHRSSQGVTQAE